MNYISKKTLKPSYGMAALLATLAAGSTLSAAITYSQTFNTTVGVVRSLDTVGWDAAFANPGDSNNAASYTFPTTGVATSPVIGSFASGGGDDSGSGPEADRGYLFHDTGLNNGTANFYYALGLTAGDAADFVRIEFDLRNDSTTENIRAAIRIGTSWFVSTNNFNDIAATSDANGWTNNLSTTGTTWAPFTFTLGSQFAIGAVETLPITGTITGVGFYDSSHSSNMRIDNVEIHAVPEPSTALIGALGVLALLRRRR